ncbi:hypothetical protein AMTR_s00037p00014430 [Amborella trichopoda]|uniref:Uncharacterized protein n=1 Tax=Amborella trichopoda TaxID=13333 RepID=U5D4Z1_AMBTC|nr:hypothetical protein AMTR_s00037p00014430 [Amborella trichopoda]
MVGFSNAEYWGATHPWKVVSGSRRDGRAGRGLVPPPFSIIFGLDHCLANWQELAKPHSLSGDEEVMRLLSLKRKTRSFFNNLDVIFGRSERSVNPSCEEGLASTSPDRVEGESHFGSSLAWVVECVLGSGCGSRNPTLRVEVSETPTTSRHVTAPAHPAVSIMPDPEATQEEAMPPLASRDPMLDVPPVDVIGVLAAPQPSSSSKALIRTQERAQLVSEQGSFLEEVASLSGELETVKAKMEKLQARVDSLSSRRDSN